MMIAIFILQCVQLVVFIGLVYKYMRLRGQKENEYYTDYIHKDLVLRVYKPEYEFQAAGNISTKYLLDRGRLSPLYDWVLIDKRGLVNNK